MSNTDYSNIYNNYNSLLERTSSSGVVNVGGVTVSTTSSNETPTSISGESVNIVEKKITTGDDIDNIWIKTWIKSNNYKPGLTGFMIDGITGDVEFGNGIFRGSIAGATIDIGGNDATSFHVDINGNMWLGASTFNISTNPFAVSSDGTLHATIGNIGGWDIQTTLLRSATTGARIELNKDKDRISIFDDTNEKVVMGYLDGLPKHDGTGNWTSSNYGFWARSGDKLSIDGDGEYINGDWIIQNDASYLIKDGSNNTIVKLGTDTGEKGLFIYNTTGTQLAKFISDEIFVGEASKYLAYDTVNGLIIKGIVTADTGYLGGTSGWTITSGKIYGGSGSAFSGLIQGTGTTKSFFAGATDNTGTAAKFYVTATGDLVATSATISGYKLFESIVASDGTGDYTSVSAALTAGKKRIFVRNGTYTNESRWNIDTDGMIIQGESKDGVNITFASDNADHPGSETCIYITNSSTLSSMSLNSFNSFSNEVKVFDTFPSKIDTDKWFKVDSDSLINYYGSYSDGLRITIPHDSTRAFFDTELLSVNSITTGLAVFESTFQWSDPGASEAIIGIGLYFNSNNYIFFESGATGGNFLRLVIVYGGTTVYNETTNYYPYEGSCKITYDFITNNIKFYIYYSNTWTQLGSTQNYNLGSEVFAMMTFSDSTSYSNADSLSVDFISLSNNNYTIGPFIKQDLITVTTNDKILFDNLNLRNNRGRCFYSANDSYTTANNIYFNYNNATDPCYSYAFSGCNNWTITNCFIDATSMPVSSSNIRFLSGLSGNTVNNLRIESGVNNVIWRIFSASQLNNCYFKFKEIILQSSCNACQFISNGYSPSSYFVTVDAAEVTVRNSYFSLTNSYNLLKVTYPNVAITDNYFDGGKKILIDSTTSSGLLSVQFISNNWITSYTNAAANLEITSDFTSTIVANNVFRNSSTGYTPTITDNGVSTVLANNALVM